MTRLVANLLDMIRVESGALAVQKQWVPLEEVVGVALIRSTRGWPAIRSRRAFPPTFRWCRSTTSCMEQVFINLLENAAKYTPAGSPIEIGARRARAK